MSSEKREWIPEVEMKYDGVSLRDLKRGLKILREGGATIQPIFSGVARTFWFNRSLEKGTSARIRIAMPDEGGYTFTTTVKRPSPHEAGGRKLKVKTKLELNIPARSFTDAHEILVEEARSLGITRPTADLVNDLVVSKRRSSFRIITPEEPDLQADADAFLTFNPDPTRYDEERRFRGKHRLTELEAIDAASAAEKEKRLLAYGDEMRFVVKPRFAPLNTKTYLKEKGEM